MTDVIVDDTFSTFLRPDQCDNNQRHSDEEQFHASGNREHRRTETE